VPRERTIAQIGAALNELGAFGASLGQQIRLEVHGTCCELPTIKAIMDIATHPNVGVCWNCNDEDLKGAGLEKNFDLVKGRLGATAHVRELNAGAYPYAQLVRLFVKAGYKGWVLLEGRGSPKDPVAALVEQRTVFEKMVADARKA
jgi:sugar phosphate isomerase/epimerase